MNLHVLIFALLAILISSCQDKTVFHQYEATDIEGWDVTERVDFSIDTLTFGGNFQPTLHLRTTTGGEYPFQALAIAVTQRWVLPAKSAPATPAKSATTTAPLATDSLLIERTDTLQCRFTTNTGHRLEKGISRSQFSYSLPQLHLPTGAVGTISITHLMRKETIPGISDVGFSLEVRD